MSDMNELVHAIRLAERLAEGIAREVGNTTRIREHLSSARIRADELAIDEGVDLIDDHATLDDRLRRAMTAIATTKGIEVATDPYASLDEIEVDFGDGKVIRMKATESDVRMLLDKIEKGNAKEVESLSDRLKLADLKLAEAKVARQTEGVEAELLYLYRIDRSLRARVREMIDARTKAA